MSDRSIEAFQRYLRRLCDEAVPPEDAVLLNRFVAANDREAFELLIARHGPMVLGTARRLVDNTHDAEDVFQAVFLSLARLAKSIRQGRTLPAWLHKTTCRIAAKVRKNRVTGSKEPPPEPCENIDPEAQLVWQEVRQALDEELQRLPERLRSPLLLCYLSGLTRDEAAKQLGWSLGTLKRRLEEGRKALRIRLDRRGIASVGLALTVLAPEALQAAVSKSLLDSSLSLIFSTGAVVPATVSVLVLSSATAMKGIAMKSILALLAAIGIGVGIYAGTGQADPPKKAEGKKEEVKPAQEENVVQLDDPLPAGALARLGWDALRLGHFSGALTPDGKKVVTLSTGAVVHIFDAATGRLLERRLLGDRRDLCPETWHFSLSADGSVAVVEEQTSSGRLTAWTVATGRQLLRLGRVCSHALSPDGRSLAAVEFVADQGKDILWVYDLETGKPRNVASSGNLSHLWFTPDGKRLLGHVAGGQADEIVCYDVAGAKRLWAVSPGAAEIGVTPDSRIVFLAKPGAKEPFRAIDLETGKPTEALKLPTCEAAGEPALAGDRLLLVPLRTGEVAVWDYRAGKELRRLRATPRDFLSVRVFAAADGKTALSDGDALRRWDLATGEQIFGPSDEPAHFGVVHALAFRPESAR